MTAAACASLAPRAAGARLYLGTPLPPQFVPRRALKRTWLLLFTSSLVCQHHGSCQPQAAAPGHALHKQQLERQERGHCLAAFQEGLDREPPLQKSNTQTPPQPAPYSSSRKDRLESPEEHRCGHEPRRDRALTSQDAAPQTFKELGKGRWGAGVREALHRCRKSLCVGGSQAGGSVCPVGVLARISFLRISTSHTECP